ncbi:UDP-glycosyltransferase 92A1, partial [Linum perenne]
QQQHSASSREQHNPEQHNIEWLQSHEPGSVLYIYFGSQNSITQSQMMQLAIGLEQSGKPFLWVTRPPIGFDPNSKSFNQEWLPEGFEHRVQQSRTGLLVRNWAPQLDILAHKSTGAFLSHCGWNSIVESLSQGVPIVAWPLAAEQGFNAKMVVEEIRAGVELARGTESEVESLEVKRVIEFAMGEEGKEMKRKAEQVAKHLMAAVRDGASEKCSSVKAMEIDCLFWEMVLRSGRLWKKGKGGREKREEEEQVASAGVSQPPTAVAFRLG